MSTLTTARVEFFIAGVQKGGTTALARFLSEHPQIQMAAKKEAHFFDKDRGNDWSNPDYSRLHSLFDWSIDDVIRGEATPIYTYWPACLRRIQQYNPSAKLIMTLRHPVFRAFSNWRMEAGRGAETLPFEAAICRLTAEPSHDGSPQKSDRRYAYLGRSRYAPQIERLLALFPRQQIHFLRTDALWDRPDATMAGVIDFLAVAPHPARREYIAPPVESETGELPVGIVTKLTESFASDIRQTEALTGLALSDWLERDYREPMDNRIRGEGNENLGRADREQI